MKKILKATAYQTRPHTYKTTVDLPRRRRKEYKILHTYTPRIWSKVSYNDSKVWSRSEYVLFFFSSFFFFFLFAWWLSSLERILGECSTIPSLPSLRFSFLFFFFFFFSSSFKWRFARAHYFHSFMPESVHSGSASWDDCGRMFPDKSRVSSFLNMFPYYARTASSQPTPTSLGQGCLHIGPLLCILFGIVRSRYYLSFIQLHFSRLDSPPVLSSLSARGMTANVLYAKLIETAMNVALVRNQLKTVSE